MALGLFAGPHSDWGWSEMPWRSGHHMQTWGDSHRQKGGGPPRTSLKSQKHVSQESPSAGSHAHF